MLSQPDSTCTL